MTGSVSLYRNTSPADRDSEALLDLVMSPTAKSGQRAVNDLTGHRINAKAVYSQPNSNAGRVYEKERPFQGFLLIRSLRVFVKIDLYLISYLGSDTIWKKNFSHSDSATEQKTERQIC